MKIAKIPKNQIKLKKDNQDPKSPSNCSFVSKCTKRTGKRDRTEAINLYLYTLNQSERGQWRSQEPFNIVVLYQNEQQEQVQKMIQKL